MAYIDYETYASMGGKAKEADFPAIETRARYILDDWTLNRLRGLDSVPEEWQEAVHLCMVEIIDNMPKTGQERVTSFSNGVNSFSFADETVTDALRDFVVRTLPIELVSAVVSYEG